MMSRLRKHPSRLLDDVQRDAEYVGSLLARQVVTQGYLSHRVERVDASRVMLTGCLRAFHGAELIPLVVAAVLQSEDRTASYTRLGSAGLASSDVGMSELLVIDIGHDDQILDPIVEFVPVDVVHNLGRQQCPSEVRSHHETMLKDVTILLAVGMAVRFHLSIPANGDDHATIPARVPVGKMAMAGQPSGVRLARHCPSKRIRSDPPFEGLAATALAKHSAPPIRGKFTIQGATKMAGVNP